MSTDTRERTYRCDAPTHVALAGAERDGPAVLNAIGVLVTMLDTATGRAVDFLLPVATGYVTAAMNVRLLRPAPFAGDLLVCSGEVGRRAQRLMLASARVLHSDHRVIATAGATCLLRSSS
jgi:acyl-coenzyme A thioesterase PaaI-like protein